MLTAAQSTDKKSSSANPSFERAARMPRNELMDLLFPLFRDSEHWSIRDLRNRTRQPEAYLREVLQEIGFLHRTGSAANMWSLLPAYRNRAMLATAAAASPPAVKEEGGEDDEGEGEEEDFDMEEVL
jgi:transcription initiation factor TFIIF subunit beta